MKKALLGVLALALPCAAVATPEGYTMDPYHTFTHFEIDRPVLTGLAYWPNK